MNDYNLDLILDISYSLTLSTYLSTQAKEFKVPVFNFMQDFDSPNEWVFNAHMSFNAHGSAMFSVIQHFGWSTVSIITSPTKYGKNCSQELYTKGLQIPNQIYWMNDVTDFHIRSQISRQFKPLGVRVTAIFAEPEWTRLVLEGSEEIHMAGEGYAFLLSAQSALYQLTTEDTAILKTGTLIIFEEETENSSSYLDYQISIVKRVLKDIANAIDINHGIHWTILGQNLHSVVKPMYSDYYRNPQFTVVNQQDSNRITVGSISNTTYTADLQVQVLWPGNIHTVPSNQKAIVPFSTNRDGYNEGAPFYTLGELDMNGRDLCIEHVNDSQRILPNHDFVSYDYGAGASYFNRDYALEKLGAIKREDFGYATILPGTSGVSMGIMGILLEFDYDIQTFCAKWSSPAMTSNRDWPYFNRINLSDDWTATIIVQMMYRFGWKRCAVLYALEPWAQAMYDKFKEEVEKIRIEIANAEQLRAIPSNLSYENVDIIEDHVLEIMESDTTILIIIMLDPLPKILIQYMYDVGIRRGRFHIVGFTGIGMFTQYDNGMIPKAYEELGPGFIQLKIKPWIGEFGQYILSSLQEKQIPYIEGSCLTYDITLGIGLTFDRMMSRGEAFENSSKFRKNYRENNYTGCSGQITHDLHTNDRRFAAFAIRNVQIQDQQMIIVSCATYNPMGSTLLTYESPIIWSNGKTTIPSDTIETIYNCPFPDGDEQIFEKGRLVTIAVCLTVGITSISITFYIQRRWWRVQFSRLRQRYEMSLADLIVIYTILPEALQLSAMGPDFRSLLSFAKLLSQAMSVNIEHFVEMQQGTYWIALNTVFAIWFIQIIWSIIVFTEIDQKCNNFFICVYFGQISSFILPLLYDFGFLPIISILLDVFIWDEGYSEDGKLDWSDSFLYRDWYVTCWQDDHITYLSASTFFLLVIFPIAVYTRPLWQSYEDDLHILKLPQYILVNTVVKIVLIILSKTLYRIDIFIHGFTFIGIMCVYNFYIYKIKAFNYERVRLWHSLSLVAVLWLALLSILDIMTQENVTYVVLMFTGWVWIIVFGLLYQKRNCPRLLYRGTRKDANLVFKFAFRRSTRRRKTQIEQQNIPNFSRMNSRRISWNESEIQIKSGPPNSPKLQANFHNCEFDIGYATKDDVTQGTIRTKRQENNI